MTTTARTSIMIMGLLALAGVGDAKPQTATAEQAAPPNAVDPEAIAALERISAFLRDQQSSTRARTLRMLSSRIPRGSRAGCAH
jgi:hypothetical protein